jgi:hypothetical protein
MNKKRQLDNIRFGLELEVEFKDCEISNTLIDKNRVIRGWEVDSDGSLESGAEYRSKDKNKLYYKEDVITQIKEILALIKVHHGKIRQSCGLHVHINMSDFSNQEICNIIHNFAKQQETIIKRFSVLKNRLEDAAQRLPVVGIEKIVTPYVIRRIKSNAYFTESHEAYHNDRHYLLNMQSLSEHGTLEFRLFNGSIQIRRIKEYVRFAIEFCLNNSQKVVK